MNIVKRYFFYRRLKLLYRSLSSFEIRKVEGEDNNTYNVYKISDYYSSGEYIGRTTSLSKAEDGVRSIRLEEVFKMRRKGITRIP